MTANVAGACSCCRKSEIVASESMDKDVTFTFSANYAEGNNSFQPIVPVRTEGFRLRN